jgi:hypothetical protein
MKERTKMHPKTLSKALIAAILVCTSYATARADLPGPLIVEYKIRETPSNPSSDVVFTVELVLAARDEDGESVGWEIKKIRLTDVDAAPFGPWIWEEVSPTVNTGDGLWWVTHSDHTDPQFAEFDVTPLLEGTATSLGYPDDLAYSFQGDTWGGTPMYGGSVSALTYSFTIEGEEDPEEEGDDEPAEVDGVDDPS